MIKVHEVISMDCFGFKPCWCKTSVNPAHLDLSCETQWAFILVSWGWVSYMHLLFPRSQIPNIDISLKIWLTALYPWSCIRVQTCQIVTKKKKEKKWSNNRQVMEKPVPVLAHPSVFHNELFIHHHVGVQLVSEPLLDFNHPHMMWEQMNRCASQIQTKETPSNPSEMS